MFERLSIQRKTDKAPNSKLQFPHKFQIQKNKKLISLNAEPKSPEYRLKILVEHSRKFEKEFGGKRGKRGHKSFAVMRKHFKAYVSGWDGAKELRAQLMEAEDSKQVDKIVKEYLKR